MMRQGDWMQTFTGRQFWPLDPRPEDVNINDIAHALSQLCRFGGHTRTFYSVAQHSVLVSRACCKVDALAGLLHDAAEAYVCDLPRPIKHEIDLWRYRQAEAQVQAVIMQKFNLPGILPSSVLSADEILLATEHRDIMRVIPGIVWKEREMPLSEIIVPWPASLAEVRFLIRFRTLTQ